MWGFEHLSSWPVIWPSPVETESKLPSIRLSAYSLPHLRHGQRPDRPGGIGGRCFVGGLRHRMGVAGVTTRVGLADAGVSGAFDGHYVGCHLADVRSRCATPHLWADGHHPRWHRLHDRGFPGVFQRRLLLEGVSGIHIGGLVGAGRWTPRSTPSTSLARADRRHHQ